ncbi:flagellar assembly factor FliW domain protein [Heliorestis convoluta]|uniref:Flagellar assembly factor FliW n=1 Tax=Heliorestis convoluta TaxID=356322 RepID=A0A5Q2N4I7_9FIRM|nr:flagellar assembly protein FliW [Heliorestis convoluta]QGG47485.1 flagellar assembly factor FliW domain protein [Heliorestis convoluta]
MLIETTRFGQIEVKDEEVYHFFKGLPGFPDEKAFVFLPYQPDSPFAFLQSTRTPELTFLLVDPFVFFPGYEVKLKDDMVEALGLSEENPAQAWSIVTIPDQFEKMTANLMAPIVLNVKERKAAQVVLERKEYTTRHAVFPEGIQGKEKGESAGKSAGKSAEGSVVGSTGQGQGTEKSSACDRKSITKNSTKESASESTRYSVTSVEEVR